MPSTKRPRRQWFPRPMLQNRADRHGRDGAVRKRTEGILETELSNGWMVAEEYELHDRRRIIASLLICPAPPRGGAQTPRMPGSRADEDMVPPGGITARLLRTIRLGQGEEVIRDLRQWVKRVEGPEALARLDHQTGRPARQQRRPQPVTRRPDDLFYAQLARTYVQLWKAGVRSPTRELAKMRGAAPAVMRSWINLARRHGLLTDTSRGKAGGTLTKMAEQVLAEAEGA